ncbi:MAG: winged helix-turn-helix domain-containing protein, partial [Kangiellaceae bacterium]|nr:winged helix-turn-helix domain-containing protein [Kangiellaceae bacterium]
MLQLLAVLIENRPHVATKEDLIRTLWPDAVVSDWSLARLISDTRKLIEDDGQQQSIIKTIRGKGFAFAAQVDEIIQAYPATDKDSAETEIHAHPDHKMHSHQSRRPISLTVITLFSITLIMIVFSAFYLNGNIIPSTNVHQ